MPYYISNLSESLKGPEWNETLADIEISEKYSIKIRSQEAANCSDPLLYPGKAGDELLSKVPPTIIWENEFDIYITEATR